MRIGYERLILVFLVFLFDCEVGIAFAEIGDLPMILFFVITGIRCFDRERLLEGFIRSIYYLLFWNEFIGELSISCWFDMLFSMSLSGDR